MSPGFPDNYPVRQNCVIQLPSAPLTTGPIQVMSFDTESRYDKLKISGTDYSGSVGPSNGTVPVGSTILWNSDYSVTKRGWKICQILPTTTGQPPASTTSPAGTTAPPTTTIPETTPPAVTTAMPTTTVPETAPPASTTAMPP